MSTHKPLEVPTLKELRSVVVVATTFFLQVQDGA